MSNESHSKIHFVVDPQLISRDFSDLLLRVLQEEKIKVVASAESLNEYSQCLFFCEKKNLKKVGKFKNKIIVVSSAEAGEDSAYRLNLSSYEELTKFVKNFQSYEKQVIIQERLKISEAFYEKGKLHLDTLNISLAESEGLEFFKSILDLEMQLLREESIGRWNYHFKSFQKKHSEVEELAILNTEELFSSKTNVDESTLIFNLPHDETYLLISLKKVDLTKTSFIVDLLLSMCTRTLHVLDQKLVKSDGEIDFWKKIFSKIPYPMAVISSQGDLLIYNESFAKIGILPKECLRFRDLENAEIFQSYYKIRRIDFPINLMQVSYFVFYNMEKEQTQNPSDKQSKKVSSIDELGIISSSIAHELNNPLAGILAALSLLSLEEDWSDESLLDLEDMKTGAKRCKELVEIFLGFSRFSPTAQNRISIKDSLDQAINLLRFRMIESNLRLDMKYSPTLEFFNHQINASVLSMIFYLVCSELMTAYAHHRLVTQIHQGFLSGQVLEFSNQVVIKLDEEFEYEEKIAQSKLIQHLLIFEKLEISFLKQEIRLIYRS